MTINSGYEGDDTYRCCEHCLRDADGVCREAPRGPNSHILPCDQDECRAGAQKTLRTMEWLADFTQEAPSPDEVARLRDAVASLLRVCDFTDGQADHGDGVLQTVYIRRFLARQLGTRP